MAVISDNYNAIEILSYNAIISEIITNRNYGKTWAFKKRAFRRFQKHGKKTIWVRTFKNEAKEAQANFYSSADLQKFCGIVFYDDKTKNGNLKQVGHTFYGLRTGHWDWFLKVCAMSDVGALRSADDINTDTIVYDEFTTTAERLKRYRGNLVNDFVDLFITAKRRHQLRCFLLGNKENVLNPFLTYFGIKPLPSTFNGIKTFRNGSIAVQQIDNKPRADDEYDKKITSLLNATQYGNYLIEGKYKNEVAFKPRKTPMNASLYIQLNVKNYEMKISILDGFFYVANKIDKTKRVYTLENIHQYKNEYLLVRRQKQLFTALINAVADNRVYYDCLATYESIKQFYIWLNV